MKQTDKTLHSSRQVVERWAQEVATLEKEIASRESEFDSNTLTPATLATLTGRLTSQRDQLAGARRVLEGALSKLAAAEREAAVEKAAEMRIRADELFAEAESHQARTQLLLSEVARHEELSTLWADRPEAQLVGGTFVVPPTKTRRLQSDARQLLFEADKLEADASGVKLYWKPVVELGLNVDYRGR